MATGFEDRFREADLLTKLARLEDLVGGLSEHRAGLLSEQFPDQLLRLRAAVLALRPRIAASEPLLVAVETLSQTVSAVNDLISGLEAFSADAEATDVTYLPDWVETLISVIPNWPAASDLPPTDASDVAARFRRAAGQQLRNLNEDFEKVKRDLGGFQEDLERQGGQWGEQKTNLEIQVKELTETIEAQRGRLDQAIENYQGQFSEAQERRSEEYRQQLSLLEAQAADTAKEAREDFGQEIRVMQVRAEKAVADLESELTKAQEITSFVGGANTGAYYKIEANSQKDAADRLRGLAIAFGLAAAGLAVWAILHAENGNNPTLATVLTKAIGSLVFAGLAGYVATQSSDHRHREERARQRELDLLSLPAFIATLPEEEKEEITGQVATKLFLTQEPVAPGSKAQAALTKDNVSLIGQLLDAIRKS